MKIDLVGRTDNLLKSSDVPGYVEQAVESY
jgi:hypothetical protein